VFIGCRPFCQSERGGSREGCNSKSSSPTKAPNFLHLHHNLYLFARRPRLRLSFSNAVTRREYCSLLFSKCHQREHAVQGGVEVVDEGRLQLLHQENNLRPRSPVLMTVWISIANLLWHPLHLSKLLYPKSPPRRATFSTTPTLLPTPPPRQSGLRLQLPRRSAHLRYDQNLLPYCRLQEEGSPPEGQGSRLRRAGSSPRIFGEMRESSKICGRRSRHGWQRLQRRKLVEQPGRLERVWGGVGACVEEEMLWVEELGGEDLGLRVEFLESCLKLYVSWLDFVV
jgi:hypothetical protein